MHAPDGAALRTAGGVIAIAGLWLLLALALYVVWFTLLSVGRSDPRSFNLLASLQASARFYVPLIVMAMAVPAALHLAVRHHASRWSWLFLSGSILLPGLLLLYFRARYVEATSRGLPLEGKDILVAFSYAAFIGLYGAVSALALAFVARRADLADRRRLAQVLICAAASSLLLHASVTASGFLPLFAWLR